MELIDTFESKQLIEIELAEHFRLLAEDLDFDGIAEIVNQFSLGET